MAEFEMLRLFILKRGFVITREYIANNVEALKWESSERSIDVIVGRIRQKIGDDPKAQKYIKTIRGSGYKMV
jgi:two-component system OmpR family response regulator